MFIVSFFFYGSVDKSKRAKILYLVIMFIPLFILSSLRSSDIGTDTKNYLSGFNSIKYADFDNVYDVVRWEVGYVFLNKISSYLSEHPNIILIITSFIALLGVFYFIYKNSTSVILSVYLYLTLYLYFFSFNGIRQAIAMSIIVMGLHFIIQRKLLKYLIMVIIATLFHETAILFIMLYFIYNLKLTYKNVLITLSSFFLIFLGIEYIINYFLSISRSLSYIDTTSLSLERGGMLFPLINISILFFVMYIKISSKGNDKKLDFFIYIILFGVLSSVLSLKIYKLLRLNYYFLIFYIVAIPYAVQFVSDKNRRLIFSYVVISVSGLYFFSRLSNGWHGVMPYEFSDFIQYIMGR